jgi:hypothetical protein
LLEVLIEFVIAKSWLSPENPSAKALPKQKTIPIPRSSVFANTAEITAIHVNDHRYRELSKLSRQQEPEAMQSLNTRKIVRTAVNPFLHSSASNLHRSSTVTLSPKRFSSMSNGS